MKRYILIAGVNGAGKSTLYQINDNFKNMPRINVDEIVKEIGDWKNIRDVFKAGKIAVIKTKEYLMKKLLLIKKLRCVESPLYRIFIRQKNWVIS